MKNYYIDYKFTIDDFKKMEKIEHTYFPNENITKAEDVLEWYKKNDLTCIGVRNKEGKIICSVNILPLEEKTFMDIYNNKINEADLKASQIEKYEDNKSYNIYLSSISIDSDYLNNYGLVIELLNGCIKLLDILESRNIKINRIMADASTTHGEKICKILLKMNYIINTSHGSKIYCSDGEGFCQTISKLKRKLKG